VSILIFLLCAIIGGVFFTSKQKIEHVEKTTKRECDRLQLLLHKYDGLKSKEEFERQLDSNILLKENEIKDRERTLATLAQEQEELKFKTDRLRVEVGELEEEANIQSFGFYQPKYSFISFGDYYLQLKQVKGYQKDMLRDDKAAICRTSWVVKDSEKEGKKLAKNFLRLVLIIFNSECDGIVSRVKPSNIVASEEKIKKHFKSLNRASQVIDCEITEEYLRLKLRELHLQYESECKKQEEKEQEQELNARMKQESKDQRKLEEENKKIREAEERERRYEQQISEALLKQEIAAEQDKKTLEAQIWQLRMNLAEATSDREEAEHRSRLVKAGYIYVISNIGSLGRDVYRICMTKRSSNEDEYVRLMNPDVPFPFDVHFKFISEDASETLRQLHQRFGSKRVNRVNLRREFFNISFDEISQAIEEIQKATGALKNIQSEKAPQAYEYRRTQAAERKDKNWGSQATDSEETA
jgi:Domain of unknown function (DUF4041)/Meiotically up-regulated gene 113